MRDSDIIVAAEMMRLCTCRDWTAEPIDDSHMISGQDQIQHLYVRYVLIAFHQ